MLKYFLLYILLSISIFVIICLPIFIMYFYSSHRERIEEKAIKTSIIIAVLISIPLIINIKNEDERNDYTKTIISMSKEELSKISENTLLKYEKQIKELDRNYTKKEKIVLKNKIDNFLKENNISLSEKEYEDALNTKTLIYNNEVVNFNVNIKDVLSIKVKEK